MVAKEYVFVYVWIPSASWRIRGNDGEEILKRVQDDGEEGLDPRVPSVALRAMEDYRKPEDDK